MTQALGTIERISDLRTIWKNEERDFSKWLAKDEYFSEMLGSGTAICISFKSKEYREGLLY